MLVFALLLVQVTPADYIVYGKTYACIIVPCQSNDVIIRIVFVKVNLVDVGHHLEEPVLVVPRHKLFHCNVIAPGQGIVYLDLGLLITLPR